MTTVRSKTIFDACRWVAVLIVAFGAGINRSDANLVRIGALGDSLTDEYSQSGYSPGRNWVDILNATRQSEFDFGSFGSRPEPRRSGYEHVWARAGATSTDLVRDQLPGLTEQMLDYVFVSVGPNDFSPFGPVYGTIYNGGNAEPAIERIVSNIVTTLDALLGPAENPSETKVVLGNVIDFGVTPYLRHGSQFPDTEKRGTVTAAVAKANEAISELAAARNIPVVDMFGLGTLIPSPSSLEVGGVSIIDNASNQPTSRTLSDAIHPGTIWQGLLANSVIEAANRGYGASFSAMSEQELLAVAGIPDPNQGQLTSFFSVSDYVILPPSVPSVPGDFNADRMLTVDDIDLLSAETQKSEPRAWFDLTGDGTVDGNDRDFWITDLKETFVGDANLDGQVDAADLNALALSWQDDDATSWGHGDFNGDGLVTSTDLNDLALNWRGGIPQAAAVPEPTSHVLLAMAVAMLLVSRSTWSFPWASSSQFMGRSEISFSGYRH